LNAGPREGMVGTKVGKVGKVGKVASTKSINTHVVLGLLCIHVCLNLLDLGLIRPDL
jgi:hypothetical protein